jgi:hypothetical protein
VRERDGRQLHTLLKGTSQLRVWSRRPIPQNKFHEREADQTPREALALAVKHTSL